MVNIKPKNLRGLKIRFYNKIMGYWREKSMLSRDTPTSQQSYASLHAPWEWASRKGKAEKESHLR